VIVVYFIIDSIRKLLVHPCISSPTLQIAKPKEVSPHKWTLWWY